MLPRDIEGLILSFLPPAPFVRVYPYCWQFDYVRIEDWNDTEEVRAYGDY